MCLYVWVCPATAFFPDGLFSPTSVWSLPQNHHHHHQHHHCHNRHDDLHQKLGIFTDHLGLSSVHHYHHGSPSTSTPSSTSYVQTIITSNHPQSLCQHTCWLTCLNKLNVSFQLKLEIQQSISWLNFLFLSNFFSATYSLSLNYLSWLHFPNLSGNLSWGHSYSMSLLMFISVQISQLIIALQISTVGQFVLKHFFYI